jgi:hypothetical protein
MGSKAVQETWELSCRVNGKTDNYRRVFGTGKKMELGGMPWRSLRNDFPQSDTWKLLYTLPGTVPIKLIATKKANGFVWTSKAHKQGGLLLQDNTPILLKEGVRYAARLVPSRKDKGGDATWRIAHLGMVEPSIRAVGAKKRPWWRRLFGG